MQSPDRVDELIEAGRRLGFLQGIAVGVGTVAIALIIEALI